MRNSVQSDEDFELWRLFELARRYMTKARARELLSLRISPEQAALMYVVKEILKRGDTPTPAEISRRLGREHHSTSVMVSRMEEKGLVKKKKDLDRKNLVRVVLTEKGRKAYALSEKRETVHEIMSVLSSKERRQMKISMKKLLDRAKKMQGGT